MKCLVCGEEFEGLRSTARYCSDKCKLAYHRGGVSVSKDSVSGVSVSEVPFVDIVKDLGLNPEKDLGIYYWTSNGVFIRPDITVDQVQSIARLIHAKHGRECVFNEARL